MEGLTSLFGRDDTEQSASIRNQGITRPNPDISGTLEKVGDFTSKVGNGITTKAGSADEKVQEAQAYSYTIDDVNVMEDYIIDLISKEELTTEEKRVAVGAYNTIMAEIKKFTEQIGEYAPNGSGGLSQKGISAEEAKLVAKYMLLGDMLGVRTGNPAISAFAGTAASVPTIAQKIQELAEEDEYLQYLLNEDEYNDLINAWGNNDDLEAAKKANPAAYYAGRILGEVLKEGAIGSTIKIAPEVIKKLLQIIRK